MSKLLIYNASAGSGKTYTLVRSFIERIVGESPQDQAAGQWSPYRFSRILCITFTRKATAEMKGRILSTLSQLAEGTSPMEHDLHERTQLPPSLIRQRAGEALHAILQDYSRLSVSTIDSFIQRMMQSLLWELQLGAEISVSLDRHRMLHLATEQLLASLQPDTPTYAWVEDNTKRRATSQQSWQVSNTIASRGALIFSEQFLRLTPAERQKIFSVLTTRHTLGQLRDMAQSLVQSLRDTAQNLDALRASLGIELSDFAYGKTSFWHTAITSRLAADGPPLPELGKRVMEAYENPESWLSQKSRATQQGQAMLARMRGELFAPFRALIEQQQLLAPRYFTAEEAIKLLPEIALLSQFREALNSVERSSASQYIEDLALLLLDMAHDSDTSFIYERMGLRYDSLFIDEFQDTSRVHWQLLQPLVANSLSQGHLSMLVGDVKQAIYRWRGGDWALLARDIPSQFAQSFGVTPLVLPTNYRSQSRIVAFNNQVFTHALESLKAHCRELIELLPRGIPLAEIVEQEYLPFERMLEEAYQGVRQDVAPGTAEQGYIELAIRAEGDTSLAGESGDSLPPDSDSEFALTLRRVDDLIDREGASPGSIAILVRRRQTATRLVTAVLAHARTRGPHAYSVVSQDALLIDASPDVQVLLSALRIVAMRASQIDRAKVARHLFALHAVPSYEWTLPSAWGTHPLLLQAEEWLMGFTAFPLLEAYDALVAGLLMPSAEGEAPYVSALRDAIFSYQHNFSVSLHAFLAHYDEQDPTSRVMDMPQSPNAINILTIHKAKGLEFDHVICPEIDWPLASPRDFTILWADVPLPDGESYLLPCRMSKNAYRTHHARRALQEDWMRAVDSLNLLYVAFTRPRKRLYLEVAGRQTSGIFGTLIGPALDAFGWGNTVETATHTLRQFGMPQPSAQHPSPHERPEDGGPTIPVAAKKNAGIFAYRPLPLRMALSAQGETSLSQLLSRRHALSLGSTLHELLAAFSSLPLLQQQLGQLADSGQLARTVALQLYNRLAARLQPPPLAQCFAPDAPAMAERSVLTPEGKTYRPDRVCLLPEATIVIDFKFAASRPAHRAQVQRYMRLLARMGHPSPRGYLWYINPTTAEDHLEEVHLPPSP